MTAIRRSSARSMRRSRCSRTRARAIDEIALADMDAAYAAGVITIAVEGAAYHAADLRERPELFSDELRAAFELGSFYQATDYVQAQRLRRHLIDQVSREMAGLDAIVMPTAPVPATPIEGSPPGACHAAAAQHHAVQCARPAGDLGAVRLHGRGSADRPADRRPCLRRGGRAAHRARLRAGHRLAPQAAALAAPPACVRAPTGRIAGPSGCRVPYVASRRHAPPSRRATASRDAITTN